MNNEQTPKPANMDLPDSKSDAERLKPESFTIDLPEVKDIPGQEHVHPAPMGEMADVTISSADEEGILTRDNGEDTFMDTDDDK